MLRLFWALGLTICLTSTVRAEDSLFIVEDAIAGMPGGKIVLDAQIGKKCLPRPDALKDKLRSSFTSDYITGSRGNFLYDNPQIPGVVLFRVHGGTIGELCASSYTLEFFVGVRLASENSWSQESEIYYIRAYRDGGLLSSHHETFSNLLAYWAEKIVSKFLKKRREILHARN